MKKVRKKPLQNLTTAIQMLYLCGIEIKIVTIIYHLSTIN